VRILYCCYVHGCKGNREVMRNVVNVLKEEYLIAV
jgi:hypothetical protein